MWTRVPSTIGTYGIIPLVDAERKTGKTRKIPSSVLTLRGRRLTVRGVVKTMTSAALTTRGRRRRSPPRAPFPRPPPPWTGVPIAPQTPRRVNDLRRTNARAPRTVRITWAVIIITAYVCTSMRRRKSHSKKIIYIIMIIITGSLVQAAMKSIKIRRVLHRNGMKNVRELCNASCADTARRRRCA